MRSRRAPTAQRLFGDDVEFCEHLRNASDDEKAIGIPMRRRNSGRYVLFCRACFWAWMQRDNEDKEREAAEAELPDKDTMLGELRDSTISRHLRNRYIRELHLMHDMGVRELARVAGMSPGQVSRITNFK